MLFSICIMSKLFQLKTSFLLIDYNTDGTSLIRLNILEWNDKPPTNKIQHGVLKLYEKYCFDLFCLLHASKMMKPFLTNLASIANCK